MTTGVFCDLDRNVLRTEDLLSAILWILFEEYGLHPETLQQEFEDATTDAEGFDLFEYLCTTRRFSPASVKLLLRDRLLSPDFQYSAAVEYAQSRREEELAGQTDPDQFTGNLLFLGATSRLVRWHRSPHHLLWITTTGSEGYQRFKLEILWAALEAAGLTADELKDLFRRVRILQENKGKYLARLWCDGELRTPDGVALDRAMVVDDKSTVHQALSEAPDSVTLIHVVRPGAKYYELTGLDRVHVVEDLLASTLDSPILRGV